MGRFVEGLKSVTKLFSNKASVAESKLFYTAGINNVTGDINKVAKGIAETPKIKSTGPQNWDINSLPHMKSSTAKINQNEWDNVTKPVIDVDQMVAKANTKPVNLEYKYNKEGKRIQGNLHSDKTNMQRSIEENMKSPGTNSEWWNKHKNKVYLGGAIGGGLLAGNMISNNRGY